MAEISLNRHLSEEALESYSLGRLPESETPAVEEHLLLCHSCQDRLEEVDRYNDTMRAALKDVQKPQQPARTWMSLGKPALALAAGVVAVLLAFPLFERTGAPQVVELSAMRNDSGKQVKARQPIQLLLSADGQESVLQAAVDVVDSRGEIRWSGAAPLSGSRWRVEVASLPAGAYWVRVYRPGAIDKTEPLREYSITLE